MRWMILPALMLPSAALAQTQSTDPAVSRQQVNSDAVETALETTATQRPTTLAGGTRRGDAQISKNEAYNLGRAASGRVGIRLGNDMSFPIGK